MNMEVSITIQTVKDLEKFQRKLFLYRSFLCRFIKFKDKDSLLPIHSFITALNIKNKKKRITYLYDSLCHTLDLYYKDKNYCKFHNNRCVIQEKKKKFENGCCRRCKYLKNEGCSTQNFACKMFYCAGSHINEDLLKEKDLPLLKCFSLHQRFILRHDYFSSREDVINDLWWESIILNCFRIYPRFISNIILKRR